MLLSFWVLCWSASPWGRRLRLALLFLFADAPAYHVFANCGAYSWPCIFFIVSLFYIPDSVFLKRVLFNFLVFRAMFIFYIFVLLHGEKNLGLNARELMSFTRGLLIVRMPQASLAMFTTTSCVQCTTSSLVLNAPTHLRKSLKSFGLIATVRCAKSVKSTTRYFQETPRAFSVRFHAIAF